MRQWLRLSLTSDVDFAVLNGEEVQEREARSVEARGKGVLHCQMQ